MSAPRVFICPKCSKRFVSTSALHMHLSAMKGRRDHTPTLPEKKRRTLLAFVKRIFGGK